MEGGGELGEGLVLLGRAVVLDELLALDLAEDRLGTRRPSDKSRRGDAWVADPLGEDQPDAPVIARVP